MQLLLRRAAAALDPVDPRAEALLASSPDSRARAVWLWDVRVARALAPTGVSAYDGAGIGPHHVVVRAADDVVVAEQRRLDLAGVLTLDRPRGELWVALLEVGLVCHGSFMVAPGDVLVWEGDDPTSIRLDPGAAPATVALVVLRRVDGAALRWVP